MGKGLPVVLMVVVIGLLVVSVLLVGKYNEAKFARDVVAGTEAEVLDWDPDAGVVTVRIEREGTVAKSRATVEFPGTMLRLSYYVAPACTEIMYELIEGVKSASWPDAFKPGDRVNVSARNLRLQKDEIPEKFVLSAISNETPRLCEE
jgi:hypothetical protein